MINEARYGDVAMVELDRPERRNALDTAHCDGIAAAVTRAVDDGARAVVVTGAGSSFCAGADFDEVYGAGFRTALYGMLQTVNALPVPVVAAVNGPAIGGGTQLAIAADFRVVANTARFAVPTANLGVAVDPWTIRRLQLVAGNAVARRMILTCESVTAPAALACGLADRAGERADAVSWATRTAELAPLTLRYSKQVLDGRVAEEDLLASFETVWSSADVAEGAAARQEKRPPRFNGR